MKKVFFAILLVSQTSLASDKFVQFLKACGYGAMAGAGLGVITLALENRPSQSAGNIARGASLGLYAGIAYGLYEYNKKPQYNLHQEYDPSAIIIIPKFDQARVEGIEVGSTVYNF